MLIKIKTILKPFYEVTKRLEGNATEGSNRALWEVVVGLECLIECLEKWKIRLEDDMGTRHLYVCADLAFNKLIEYVRKKLQDLQYSVTLEIKIAPTTQIESKISFDFSSITQLKLLDHQQIFTFQTSIPYTSPKTDQTNRFLIPLSNGAYIKVPTQIFLTWHLIYLLFLQCHLNVKGFSAGIVHYCFKKDLLKE